MGTAAMAMPTRITGAQEHHHEKEGTGLIQVADRETGLTPE
jgi:hypothetical protein